jgi:hypothetical protein
MADQMRQIKSYQDEYGKNMDTFFGSITKVFRGLNELVAKDNARMSKLIADKGIIGATWAIMRGSIPGAGGGLPDAVKVPSTKSFRQHWEGGMGGSISGPVSPWERMGFQFSGAAGSRDYAKEIAHNTKVMADHITGKTGMSQTIVPFTSYVPNGAP